MPTNPNMIVLDSFLLFKKEVVGLFTPELKKYGFGLNQMRTISILDEMGQLTASEIGDITLADKASTTRTIAALEKMGWIKKIADSEDRRRTYIELTAKGRKNADKIHEIRFGVGEKINKVITLAEREELARIISKIVSNLQKNKKEEGSHE